MDTDISKGCIVLSVAGRDKGKYFYVLNLDSKGYALLVDGRLRRADSPKRKKLRHLMYAAENNSEKLLSKILSDVIPEDAEIRKAMNLFLIGEETT